MSAWASGLVALAITVLGLLMGPVNLIYCGFFSGSKVATHRLELGRPLVLQLSPEMNTIEFKTNVAFNSNGPRQREEELQQLRELLRKSVNVKRYHYHAVLTAEGETIWERGFPVLRPAEVPHPISMTTFSVDRAGTYTLTVRRDPDSLVRRNPDLRSPAGVPLLLHISRNVLFPNLAVMTLGFFMMVFGVGCLLLVILVRSAPSSEQDSEQISTEEIPYRIECRPMPQGKDINVLLPVRVGSHTRDPIDEPLDTDNPIYATYRRTGGGSVFVELGICEDPRGAQRALETAKAETDAEFPGVLQLYVRQGDIGCLRTVNRLGALMAWTRGPYYFSAHAKRGEKELDEFMEVFPY